ncbi:hypothetical protein M900_2334 [Bacteriovorax sp. Seq25_V]|nr:hypothetical protein M900_2334 [Bacteriovorax sp. Seq25_V]
MLIAIKNIKMTIIGFMSIFLQDISQFFAKTEPKKRSRFQEVK